MNAKRLQNILDSASNKHIFPGAVLAITHKNGSTSLLNSGYLDYDSGQPMPSNAIFDLASITKVIATTTLTMLLTDSGKININTPVCDSFPDFTDVQDEQQRLWRKTVTPKHLLAHCAGFPPGDPFYIKHKDVTDKKTQHLLVRKTPIVTAPGTVTAYSDIGMMIMAQIIEHITQQPLEKIAQELIFKPLGMNYTSFNPKQLQNIPFVPTEEIKEKPSHFWTGIVHDENARWLKGAAGHAGLFSNAPDLAIFASMMLNNGMHNGHIFISQDTLDLFTRKAGIVHDSSRCLGWDGPSPNCAGGSLISPDSFGHTGFTGTSIWLDKSQNIAVILLTNAVHPHRECKANGYFKARNEIHTAAYSLTNTDSSW